MQVTIKNIAEYAGVSIGTVSRALNNDPLIAIKTRAKIKELASKLDYVPNNIGKGLQSQKSYLIGYLISNMKDSFYNDILQGIGNIACENNYGLLVAITDDNHKSETEQLKIFREKSVDGIIVSNYQPETIKYLQKIEKTGTPIVLSDIESFDNEIPTVRTDDVKASEMLMEHLVNLGHKNIAYCYSINSNSRNRHNACCNWATKNNTQIPVLCENEEQLVSFIHSDNTPTAVIAYSDKIAIEIIQLFRSMKLNVPHDISVTGFDNIDIANWPEYKLTTINQPKNGLGSMAAELLFNKINGNTIINSITIKPELIIRNSTTNAKNRK